MSVQPRPAPPPVVVTHALRTPIGRFCGSFAELSAADLGVSVVSALLARSAVDPSAVGELIFGNARQAGGGPNVARQVSVRAGIPVEVPAWTVNMACGSGLKALALAVEGIRAGRTEVAVAGGTESMSGLPFLLPRMRLGYRLGHAPVVDGMYQDGFLCPLSKMLMGETADKLGAEYALGRGVQDEFALESQRRAAAAVEAGRFADEIAPVTVPGRKGDTVVEADEHLRPQTTLAALAKLPPVFDAESGTVTAGNASGITDGAAALLVMSEARAQALGLEPLAWVGETAEAGVPPDVMGLGPVPAVRSLERRNGLGVGDYDLIELNEAFAAQVLACARDLELPMERVNVNGGAIALGHPIGATGARIVVTLLHELARRDARRGLATLCISGGLGLATAFERRSA
ncbi:MAG TPA: thiolase family protein [Planctomycetota bacterium]|nr:thiolase family protein [Planctomycetota bacterium]